MMGFDFEFCHKCKNRFKCRALSVKRQKNGTVAIEAGLCEHVSTIALVSMYFTKTPSGGLKMIRGGKVTIYFKNGKTAERASGEVW